MDIMKITNDDIFSEVDLISNIKNKGITFEEILQTITQGSSKLNIATFKDFFTGLQGNKFTVNEPEYISTNVNEKLQSISEAQWIETNEIENVEKFINEKFYNILIEKIESEVKETRYDIPINNFKPSSETLNSNSCNNLYYPLTKNNNLIEYLKSEIFYLREEVSYKNKLIESLLEDTLNMRSLSRGCELIAIKHTIMGQTWQDNEQNDKGNIVDSHLKLYNIPEEVAMTDDVCNSNTSEIINEGKSIDKEEREEEITFGVLPHDDLHNVTEIKVNSSFFNVNQLLYTLVRKLRLSYCLINGYIINY